MYNAVKYTSIAVESMTEKQQRNIETTKSKLHKCLKCGKGYTSKVFLKRHLQLSKCKQHKLIYTGDRPYACSFCKKTFNRLSSCKKHELIHSGKRPYACSLCEKTFNRISNCKRHELIHTREKPYACSFCEKNFNRISSCKKHELIHTGERPYYACSFCKKSFTSIFICKQHELIHTGERPYACSFCDKTFQRISIFKQHELIHTGERPYACAFCEKTFTAMSNCKRHERLHTDKSPCVCETCHMEFDSLSNLQQHVPTLAMKNLYKCGKGIAQFETPSSAVGECENDTNENVSDSDKFEIETEETNSCQTQNYTIESLVNNLVSAAKLQGVALHMSVAADEGIVNFVKENQSTSGVDKGNSLSSVDIAKILRMVSEQDNIQSKIAANTVEDETDCSVIEKTVNCQSEKSKYSSKLLIPTVETSSYQPQNNVRDTTMDYLAKALTSAAKLQGVVLHVYCLK